MSEQDQRVFDMILQRLDSMELKIDTMISREENRVSRINIIERDLLVLQHDHNRQCGTCKDIHDEIFKRQREIEEMIKNAPKNNRTALQAWVAIVAGGLSAVAITLSLIRGFK
jgi:hypothetical protein